MSKIFYFEIVEWNDRSGGQPNFPSLTFCLSVSVLLSECLCIVCLCTLICLSSCSNVCLQVFCVCGRGKNRTFTFLIPNSIGTVPTYSYLHMCIQKNGIRTSSSREYYFNLPLTGHDRERREWVCVRERESALTQKNVCIILLYLKEFDWTFLPISMLFRTLVHAKFA